MEEPRKFETVLRNLVDWRILAILLVACTLSFIIYGYSLGELPLGELPHIAFRSIVLYFFVLLIGLNLAKRVGLEATPLLRKKTRLKSILPISVGMGILAALIIIPLGVAMPLQLGEGVSVSQAAPPVWESFLASFYDGINEEVFGRLFIVTLIAWLLSLAIKKEKGRAETSIMWTAIVIGAVLFGLGHLPATALLTRITPYVVAHAILLNGIAGVIFGYLYWRQGIESAMLSHFSADIVLHVLLPLLTMG